MNESVSESAGCHAVLGGDAPVLEEREEGRGVGLGEAREGRQAAWAAVSDGSKVAGPSATHFAPWRAWRRPAAYWVEFPPLPVEFWACATAARAAATAATENFIFGHVCGWMGARERGGNAVAGGKGKWGSRGSRAQRVRWHGDRPDPPESPVETTAIEIAHRALPGQRP